MRRPHRTPASATALACLALALGACGQGGNEVDVDVQGTATAAPTGTVQNGELTFAVDGVPDVVATIATGLTTPWGVAFLPDGRAVVTERDTGRVLVVTAPAVDGEPTEEPGEVVEIGTIAETQARSEGGLLGVAVSPTFSSDGLLFFYVSTADDNRIVRATFDGESLGATEPIVTGIPVAERHNGGALTFGPDGFLYASTGDAEDGARAQARKSLGGKILRMTADGEPAPDNPFKTLVWSMGHRNVEGLTFDMDSQLWASEFGDQTADELNRILPGANYGWPQVEGDRGPAKFTRPSLTWSAEEASPAGVTYAGGYLWMAALRGERLWRIKVASGQVSDPAAYFAPAAEDEQTFGRLRTVVRDPSGRLWLTTSNTDGRGEPGEGDDRILLVEP
ncbi:PQQ-dependent sugar dehydrogenase [Nocardioides caeni]|uniref:PQQ-dependent sugar dehydrogenase n=1 Tax=Nocardioides caeni TaxID=574700 RepID=A0A4S8NLE8_9ACTN|nr:PQQ-dependent sugar dehydrogenase [Nocardioides caeni]THV17820.1 PQQ-dependent sugar dehydrogenase [Nocardioides caeni]